MTWLGGAETHSVRTRLATAGHCAPSTMSSAPGLMEDGGTQSMKDESYGHQVRDGSARVLEAGPCIDNDLGLEHVAQLFAQAADLDWQALTACGG